jgi:hypothetical protein
MLRLLQRLWQPRRPLFWLWLAFNLLSAGFGWALRLPGLTDAALALFTALALANVAAALAVLWALLRLPAPGEAPGGAAGRPR